MQEDERNPEESQPEAREEPSSKQAADQSQPPAEEQQASEGDTDQKQPEPQPQPPPESTAGPGQTGPRLPPPPGVPTPLPLTGGQKRRHYFLGLGFGLIPLIILLVSFGIGTGQGTNGLGTLIIGALLAVILYIAELIVTIIFLVNKNLRFAGYGLLTAFLASPIIAAVGCNVIPQLVHP